MSSSTPCLNLGEGDAIVKKNSNVIDAEYEETDGPKLEKMSKIAMGLFIGCSVVVIGAAFITSSYVIAVISALTALVSFIVSIKLSHDSWSIKRDIINNLEEIKKHESDFEKEIAKNKVTYEKILNDSIAEAKEIEEKLEKYANRLEKKLNRIDFNDTEARKSVIRKIEELEKEIDDLTDKINGEIRNVVVQIRKKYNVKLEVKKM